MNLLRPFLLLVLLASGSAWAGDAGKLLFVLGEVQIERAGQRLPAQRGMTVLEGDTLQTGKTGRTQIRFIDGALMALRPLTTFTIEEMRLAAPAPVAAAPAPAAPAAATPASPAATPAQAYNPPVIAPAQPAQSQGSRAIMRLLRGGFRTISGLIGKAASDEYRVSTPVATIGIRGTKYSVYTTPEKTDTETTEGTTYVSSSSSPDSGIEVNAGQQASVTKDETSLETAPIETLQDEVPPEEQTEEDTTSETPGQATTAAAEESGTDYAPPADDGSGETEAPPSTAVTEDTRPVTEETEPEVEPATVSQLAYSTQAFAPQRMAATGDGQTNLLLDINSSGGLDGFEGVDGGGNLVSYRIGSSSNVNQGLDPNNGLRWGRWSGGTASAGSNTISLSSQSLHWIYGEARDQLPALPITGSASFIVTGNTDPTDTQGNSGAFGSATLLANFNTMMASTTLDLAVNNATWSASGSAAIDNTAAFFGNYSSVTMTPSQAQSISGNGSFAGFFVSAPGALDGSLPSGAGLSYHLTAGSSSVTGAVAFGQASPVN